MEDTRYYYVKNWWEYQHYRDRTPPWIKVHRRVLSNEAFLSLSPSDRWYLIRLWIDASEHEGTIPARSGYVRATCGLGSDYQASCLLARLERKLLISLNDVRGPRRVVASKSLASKTETETEKEKHPPTVPHRGTRKRDPDYSEAFLKFWQAYPRKSGKGSAWAVFERLKVNGHMQEIIAAIEAQKRTEQWKRDGGQYIPHPATWLRQRRWEDETADDSGFDLE